MQIETRRHAGQHFWWAHGHTDRWVRLAAWGFLLVVCSSYGCKNAPFLSQWHETDGQTLPHTFTRQCESVVSRTTNAYEECQNLNVIFAIPKPFNRSSSKPAQVITSGYLPFWKTLSRSVQGFRFCACVSLSLSQKFLTVSPEDLFILRSKGQRSRSVTKQCRLLLVTSMFVSNRKTSRWHASIYTFSYHEAFVTILFRCYRNTFSNGFMTKGVVFFWYELTEAFCISCLR